MQNVECEMQNEGVAYGDLFQSFPKEIPQFCILHFEFCMPCVSTINPNLPSLAISIPRSMAWVHILYPFHNFHLCILSKKTHFLPCEIQHIVVY